MLEGVGRDAMPGIKERLDEQEQRRHQEIEQAILALVRNLGLTLDQVKALVDPSKSLEQLLLNIQSLRNNQDSEAAFHASVARSEAADKKLSEMVAQQQKAELEVIRSSNIVSRIAAEFVATSPETALGQGSARPRLEMFEALLAFLRKSFEIIDQKPQNFSSYVDIEGKASTETSGISARVIASQDGSLLTAQKETPDTTRVQRITSSSAEDKFQELLTGLKTRSGVTVSAPLGHVTQMADVMAQLRLATTPFFSAFAGAGIESLFKPVPPPRSEERGAAASL